MMVVVIFLVVYVDRIEKDLRRIQSLALVPVTATYEAAITVEVWSLCSPGSTCTETRGVDMDYVSCIGEQ